MAKSSEMAAHFRLQATAVRYLERTGRVVTMPQLRYWGRGGKVTHRVFVYNMRNIQKYVKDLEERRRPTPVGKYGYRYYFVVRISGTDEAQRKYELEFALVYYRDDLRPFSPGYTIERRAARAGLEWAAQQYDAWVPDEATGVEDSTEVEFTFKRKKPYFHFKDNASDPPREFSGPLNEEELMKVMDDYYELGA
tara:strand:- start:3016 stop:3597 length:582 start_codon:yes stop_codon:yes gene_type:complete